MSNILSSPARWIKDNQAMLLSLARTAFGRDLLGIDRALPRIVQITSDGFTSHLGGLELQSHFTPGTTPMLKRLVQFEGPLASYMRYFSSKDYAPFSPLTNAALSAVCIVDPFTADVADRGMVSDGGSSWPNTRNGTGSVSLEAVDRVRHYAVAWRYSATNYAIYRAWLWWTTGTTIPSENTITAASLEVYFSITHAAVTRDFYLVENRQASTALATSDWTRIGASGVGTGTGQPFGTVTRTPSEAASSETFTINSDGWAKIAQGSGNTYFSVVESDDWNNTTPGSESTAGAEFNSADAASNKPTLSVTHTAPATSKHLMLLGIG